MIHQIVFSCAGTTGKVADAISSKLDSQIRSVDLTSSDFKGSVLETKNDIVLFAVPVWGGRVPALAAERLRRIKGDGQKAIAVVVYGNRDYDDALAELCRTVSEKGFSIVAAAAFVAEHCIFPTVATGRPDEMDSVAISRFALDCKRAIDSGNMLDLNKIKGNRPYKKAAGVPLHPRTDSAKCVKCRACVSACPYDAIDPETLETDKARCSSCCRCISVCTQGARNFSGLMYKTVRFAFEKMCAKRREPKTFL